MTSRCGLLSLGLVLVGAGAPSAVPDSAAKPPATPPPGYKLAWSDEFEHDGLPDPDKWVYEEGFVRNNEEQYYTRGRLENCRVENHRLIIEGRKEHFPNAHYRPNHAPNAGRRDGQEFAEYTSASIQTRGKASWTYGRIEVRAKLPRGKGQWPAIWMLGDKRGWPACGEIDIMEWVGKEPGAVHATMHWLHDGKHASNGKQLKVTAPWEDFHVYAADWTPEHVDCYYDDTKYQSFAVKDGEDQGHNPFTESHFLLINLALGGSWGGAIDDSVLPQQYVIDYVRVYQKAE
jgi:beta-glucanase (GH16 family)